MNKLYKKIIQKWLNLSQKRQIFYTTLLSILLLVIIIPSPVKADLGSAIASIIGWVLSQLITWLSKILTLELSIFVIFAKFNNFLSVTAVQEGWRLVRDVCNMFFIVILLVISFATILKIESYAYKKWLGKLVIAAILINFSKTITGILIGFSQVAMLTFVSAFKDAVAGNLGAGLHLNEMMNQSIKTSGVGNDIETTGIDFLDGTSVFAALLLAFALISIFAIVMLIMIVVLVGRIVSLWVLVILSPVAFLFQASPFGTKYAKQWWQELGKNLVAGPVLAFFLWLAFLTVQRSSGKVAEEMYGSTIDDTPELVTGISSTSALMDYIITIALLLVAIKMTQEMGVIGSSFAGKMQQGMGSLAKKAAMVIPKKVGKEVAWHAGNADRWISRKTGGVLGFQSHRIRKEKKEATRAESIRDQDETLVKINDKYARAGGLRPLLAGGSKDIYKEYAGMPGVIKRFRDTFRGSSALRDLDQKRKDLEKEKDKKKKLKDEENSRKNVKDAEQRQKVLQEKIKVVMDIEAKYQKAESEGDTENAERLKGELKVAEEEVKQARDARVVYDNGEEDNEGKKHNFNNNITDSAEISYLASLELEEINEERDKILKAKKSSSEQKKINKMEENSPERIDAQAQLDSEYENKIKFSELKVRRKYAKLNANDEDFVNNPNFKEDFKKYWSEKNKKRIALGLNNMRSGAVYQRATNKEKTEMTKKYYDGVADDFNNHFQKLKKIQGKLSTREIVDLPSMQAELNNLSGNIRDKKKAEIDQELSEGIEKINKKRLSKKEKIEEIEDFTEVMEKRKSEVDDQYSTKEYDTYTALNEDQQEVDKKILELAQGSGAINEAEKQEEDDNNQEFYRKRKGKIKEALDKDLDPETRDEFEEKREEAKRLRDKVNKGIDNAFGNIRAKLSIDGVKLKDDSITDAIFDLKKVLLKEKDKNKIEKYNNSLTKLEKLRNDRNSLSSDEDIKRKFDTRKLELKQKRISNINDINSDSIGKIAQQASEKIENKIVKFLPVSGLDARSSHRALVDERKKELVGMDSNEELILFLRKAISNKDKYRALAVMEKMAADGNDNEFLNAFTGNDGKKYESNAIGMHKFVQEQLVGKLGMKQQDALSFQNDVGFINEKVGHWDTARTVKVKSDGSFVSAIKDLGRGKYDDTEHALECFAEISKMQSRDVLRSLNRLAYGGEVVRPDGSGRDFKFSRLGKMVVTMLNGDRSLMEKRADEMNINAAQNFMNPQAIKTLERLVGKNSTFYKTAGKVSGEMSGVRADYESVMAELKRLEMW